MAKKRIKTPGDKRLAVTLLITPSSSPLLDPSTSVSPHAVGAENGTNARRSTGNPSPVHSTPPCVVTDHYHLTPLTSTLNEVVAEPELSSAASVAVGARAAPSKAQKVVHEPVSEVKRAI
ncbi:MAG: hypothetical protein AAF797_11190 [Planctomycetota bacterium]